MAQSVLVGRFVVNDREAIHLAFLYPLRDLLGSLLWMASYASRRVGWRGDVFELTSHGVVRPISAEERHISAHQSWSPAFASKPSEIFEPANPTQDWRVQSKLLE
jgi:hypothetical protein